MKKLSNTLSEGSRMIRKIREVLDNVELGAKLLYCGLIIAFMFGCSLLGFNMSWDE